jgi:hypothetical protein
MNSLESFDFDISDYKVKNNSPEPKKNKRKCYPLYKNYSNGSEKYYKRIVDEDPVWDGTRILFINDVGSYLSGIIKHPLLKKFQKIDCTILECKNKYKLREDFLKFEPDIVVAVGKSAPLALRINNNIPVVLVDPEDFFVGEERKAIILNSKRDIYDQLRDIISFVETDVSPDKYPLYAF